ncbi:MAG: glycosyltransferase family 4 protein, partial [Halioglobus sp.]|nr:glycosyltransferase family 4 protein [Halioglobus sp.]
FVNEVDDWLSVFDVFVFPSLHEGLGSTLLDAMSFGLPIVATNVGGIPDIVTHGVNGLLIEPERPEALLAAILRINQDESLRSGMRRANLAQADAYSPAAMADRYEVIYHKLLKSRD